jgi:hypothetical protein
MSDYYEAGTIGSIDIRSLGFFWMLCPWKKGTLVTMDGRARFAELSFVGRSRIRITSLVNFPRERIDGILETAPEAGVCVVKSGAEYHIADISSRKTKSLVPLINWRFSDGLPYILDSINGIILFAYFSLDRHGDNMPSYNIIYDAKNDRILYKSPDRGESISIGYGFSPEMALTTKQNSDNTQEVFLYNWKTREITRNELTERFTVLGIGTFLGHNINLKGRFLFTNIGEEKTIKLTWDENYEDVTVIPLDYMIPNGKWLYRFTISANGCWATTFVGGYKGLYGESLVKRAFFHLDGLYPNGISMPIFADGYDKWHYEIGSFVEHPAHGWCFAEEKYLNERLFLRLYKMSDVLEEINRQILEKANDLMR